MKRAALWIASIAFAAGSASAAVFTVNTAIDQPDNMIGNGICSISSGGPCSLRAAVQEANASAGEDLINLGPGTFELVWSGAGEDFAATGDLDLRDQVTIQGAGEDSTTVDGSGLDRVFDIPFGAATFPVQFRFLTISGGALSDSAGAGIRHADDDTLALDFVTLSFNDVAGTTSNATGGALAIVGGGIVRLQNCVLTHNGADRGGAIFSNSTLRIFDSTISANHARAGSAIESYGSTTIQTSTIQANAATGGGTVDVADQQLSLLSSTISGNEGTGAAVVAGGESTNLYDSTIFDNATAGSIRTTSGIVEAFGVVLAGSSGTECIADGGVFVTLEYNFDDDGSCVPSGTTITAADPKLGPLADNGGPTLTRAPLFDSPLIDAGETLGCGSTDQRGSPRPADGGGTPGARCDIGAVELAPEPASIALGAVALCALAGNRFGRRLR